jgi:hypothetical protein
MQKLMKIREVAAFIPCHPRTLRVTLADPELAKRAPQPLPRPTDGHPYRFEKAAVDSWLQKRSALRERLRKPHLRWCDPAAGIGSPDVALVGDIAERRTEAAITLELREHFQQTLGDRLSPKEIDTQVLAVMQRARGVREQEAG